MSRLRGTCDGTGAAIYVCLGAKPKWVKVYNLEDAGSLWPSVEWSANFRAITAGDEGIKELESGGDLTRALLSANGISLYNGGDVLVYDGVTNNRWEDVDGADVREKFVDGTYERDASGDTAFKCIGDSILGKTPSSRDDGARVVTTPGFIIGTDGDLNVDGEQLCWEVET